MAPAAETKVPPLYAGPAGVRVDSRNQPRPGLCLSLLLGGQSSCKEVKRPPFPSTHIFLLGHSHHLVLANDGGAPPPKLACSPSGPQPPHPFFLSRVPSFTLWPRPGPRGRSLSSGVTSPRLLMVVPWSLQSQSRERCQSPTIPPAPCPQGLVTFRPDPVGAPGAWSSVKSNLPGASWGGDPCPVTPFRSPAPQC